MKKQTKREIGKALFLTGVMTVASIIPVFTATACKNPKNSSHNGNRYETPQPESFLQLDYTMPGSLNHVVITASDKIPGQGASDFMDTFISVYNDDAAYWDIFPGNKPSFEDKTDGIREIKIYNDLAKTLYNPKDGILHIKYSGYNNTDMGDRNYIFYDLMLWIANYALVAKQALKSAP